MTFTFQMSSNNHSPGPRFSSSLFQTDIKWFFLKISEPQEFIYYIVMNVKMIDDQKLSLVGNFSMSSTFLEIFKNLTAFFFKKASSKSSFVGLWDHSLEAGCSLLQRPAPWRLEPPRDEPFPSTAVCVSTFQGARGFSSSSKTGWKTEEFQAPEMWNASVFRRDFAFIYQVIQAVTFLYTLFGGHLTFERVT